MNIFSPFDPLKAKSLADTEVAALAQKREIKNILGSYIGWYDPFCELIQNALDSIEERATKDSNYVPTIWITINIKNNSLSVTDNGVGLDEEKFQKFLCPDITFKSGKTRGHKGVGATYLAYGFNYIQVATKSPDFVAIGKMEGARNWLNDESPSGNPQMKPDEKTNASAFDLIDRGVSVFVKFDQSTHPKDLKWVVADKAEQWIKILSVKTGLGAFLSNKDIKVFLKVYDRDGKKTELEKTGIEYYLPHIAVQKSASLKQINTKMEELFKKKGRDFELPSRLKNLDAFYERWTSQELLQLLADDEINLDEEEKEVITKFEPEVYASNVYSLKVWDAINQELNIRAGSKILYGGIQIAANNMPQGETIQIPLNRNIGRQNQIHILIHFNNCSPDLGRKGFQSEIVEFAKSISKQIADGPFKKITFTLRANTGTAPNLKREQEVENWKNEMIEYEEKNPIELINQNFFLPLQKISITSKPTREQDVIALFNQLLAGGVIRGVRIMSTNERLTYDGLYRVAIEPPNVHHLYNAKENPLGIEKSVLDEFALPFTSEPKVLEYKYSLDGLIEDIESGIKNSNDIGLVVVWETGEEFRENYKITSYLDPDNLSLREYHGVTHTITNIVSQQREMEMIVLSELIEYLNDQEKTIEEQRKKYED
ncbi:MAG: ATP-binding protein [Bacteroidetes bacterium]|nr:ATP-binding protein [Bacteroidota bacterium]